MENKIYKYVGIAVIAFLVITLVIRLFHLNTQVIEGLTIQQVKEEEEELEKQEGTPLEKILLKLSKNNENNDKFLSSLDKEITEDILLELDENCNKAILLNTLFIVNKQGNISFSDKGIKPSEADTRLQRIEQYTTLKKAIAQSIEYLTGNAEQGESKNTGGMFS